MTKLSRLLKVLLDKPLKLLTRSKIVAEEAVTKLVDHPQNQIYYVIKTNSVSDLIVLEKACLELGLPSPNQSITQFNQVFPRTLCLENPAPLFSEKAKSTEAYATGVYILNIHQQQPSLDSLVIPVTIFWGRDPGKEIGSVKAIIADRESPSWLRKIFIVISSLRHNFIRLSAPVSLQQLLHRYGSEKATSKKLLRIARFHFYRQQLVATGPRLWSQDQMFNSLLAANSIKKAIKDEMVLRRLSQDKAKERAEKYIYEVAANYSNNVILLSDRLLTWVWNKLYKGLKVYNEHVPREVAAKGHEIIYVPCHRSHMDYLLLTYVIYHIGLVPPHIAAGINLSFWPLGPIFRRCGAFFMRRSFRGNKLYSAIFREYLSQLFEKGYPVKYFTEGGRSRSGRLLTPKTGMLAMTIQSLLKGVDRPITLVPVYIGYEHVMEVNTYLKELRGSAKKSESIGGIFRALSKLRDYGFGYVNFGRPINLNEYLSQQVPEWRQSIDPLVPQKPQWLTPTVNGVAQQVLTRINDAVTLNAVNLAAISLLATKHNALSRRVLENQISFYKSLFTAVPYSEEMILPDMSNTEIIDHLISLNKVTVEEDPFGQIIKLTPKAGIILSYYRNNVNHVFTIPSLIAAQCLLLRQCSIEQLYDTVSILYPLFKDEWFLNDQDPVKTVDKLVEYFVEHGYIKREKDILFAPDLYSNPRIQLKLLGRCVEPSIQRFGIVLSLLAKEQLISRSELESQSHVMAKRLLSIHGIKAPEFFDRKSFNTLVTSLKRHQYVLTDENGQFKTTAELNKLTHIVTSMLGPDLIHTIDFNLKSKK